MQSLTSEHSVFFLFTLARALTEWFILLCRQLPNKFTSVEAVWGRYWNLARFCRFLTFQEIIQDFGVITSSYRCRQGRSRRNVCAVAGSKLCSQICPAAAPHLIQTNTRVEVFAHPFPVDAGEPSSPSSTFGWGAGVLAQLAGRWLRFGSSCCAGGQGCSAQGHPKASWGWPEPNPRAWGCEIQPGGEGWGLSWGGKWWRTPNWALAQSAEQKTGSMRANCNRIYGEKKTPCEGGVQEPGGCSILSSEPPAHIPQPGAQPCFQQEGGQDDPKDSSQPLLFCLTEHFSSPKILSRKLYMKWSDLLLLIVN